MKYVGGWVCEKCCPLRNEAGLGFLLLFGLFSSEFAGLESCKIVPLGCIVCKNCAHGYSSREKGQTFSLKKTEHNNQYMH